MATESNSRDFIKNFTMFFREKSCQPEAFNRSLLTVAAFSRQSIDAPHDILTAILQFHGINHKTYVSLSTLHGLEQHAKEIHETLGFYIDYPEIFTKWGFPATRGYVLYGPRGCGQELLAKSVAYKADYNYFTLDIHHLLSSPSSQHYSEFIHTLFDLCTENAPCILVVSNLDELAIIADNTDPENSNKASDLSQALLSQIDALPPIYQKLVCFIGLSHGEIVGKEHELGAHGRLDKFIFVDLPSLQDRENILSAALDVYEWREYLDIDDLVKRTHGFNRTDLECFVDAMIAAMKMKENSNTEECVTEAVDDALRACQPSVSAEEYQAILAIKKETEKPYTLMEDNDAAAQFPPILVDSDDSDDIYD